MFGNLWENARSNKWCFLINVMWQNLQNGRKFNTIQPGIWLQICTKLSIEIYFVFCFWFIWICRIENRLHILKSWTDIQVYWFLMIIKYLKNLGQWALLSWFYYLNNCLCKTSCKTLKHHNVNVEPEEKTYSGGLKFKCNRCEFIHTLDTRTL